MKYVFCVSDLTLDNNGQLLTVHKTLQGAKRSARKALRAFMARYGMKYKIHERENELGCYRFCFKDDSGELWTRFDVTKTLLEE